jgi:outer membrane lipoprotein SlyB
MSAAIGIAQPALAGDKSIKNQNFVVNLTSPISTKDSKAGDLFTAQVLDPPDFQGSVVEGHIRKVEPAQNGGAPKSKISFAFETMTVGDTTYKIQADLVEVVNSKGVAKVDEEGQVIAKGNGGKRAMAGLGGAGIGAFAGGMLGGSMGSLIGGAVGGAAGYLVSLDVTASSQNIEFYPGTHFTLQVNSKGIDKNIDAAEVKRQEAAAESAMASRSSVASGSDAPAPAQGTTDASGTPANTTSTPQQ